MSIIKEDLKKIEKFGTSLFFCNFAMDVTYLQLRSSFYIIFFIIEVWYQKIVYVHSFARKYSLLE